MPWGLAGFSGMVMSTQQLRVGAGPLGEVGAGCGRGRCASPAQPSHKVVGAVLGEAVLGQRAREVERAAGRRRRRLRSGGRHSGAREQQLQRQQPQRHGGGAGGGEWRAIWGARVVEGRWRARPRRPASEGAHTRLTPRSPFQVELSGSRRAPPLLRERAALCLLRWRARRAKPPFLALPRPTRLPHTFFRAPALLCALGGSGGVSGAPNPPLSIAHPRATALCCAPRPPFAIEGRTT